MPARALRLGCAIALVSAAALAYQLLLMRWLAIAHWHPLAVVIISLALLGHGASGSVLSVWGARAVARFDAWFPIARTRVRGECGARVAHRRGHSVQRPRTRMESAPTRLAGVVVPVPVGAVLLRGVLLRTGVRAPWVADPAAVWRRSPRRGRRCGCWRSRCWNCCRSRAPSSSWPRSVRRAAAILMPALRATHRRAWRSSRSRASRSSLAPSPPVNEYKALAKALLVRDARIVATREGAQGWLAVLESPARAAAPCAGLSLAKLRRTAGATRRVRRWRFSGRARRSPRSAAHWPTCTARHRRCRMRSAPAIACWCIGAGVDVATCAGARRRARVDVVERDARIVDIARRTARRVHRPPLRRSARARAHRRPARLPARRSRRVRPHRHRAGRSRSRPATPACQAVAEDYLATVEALRDVRAHLAHGGVLAITRLGQGAAARCVETVRHRRRPRWDEPRASVAMLRNWDAWTLRRPRAVHSRPRKSRASARSPTTTASISCTCRASRAHEANRFHVQARDDAFLGAQALLSPRRTRYIAHYKFDIAPARDDRPYFANFFRWSTLPELWRLRAQGRGGAAGFRLPAARRGVGAGVAAGGRARAAALARVAARRAVRDRALARGGVFHRARAWDSCWWRSPACRACSCWSAIRLLAIGAGLAGFLVFAGARQHAGRKRHRARAADARGGWRSRDGHRLAWHLATFAIALRIGAAWPPWARCGAALPTIAPLAFAMGLPFPLGLSRLAREAPDFVPWAWGLNGCASVVAAIAALLVALACRAGGDAR